MAKVFGNVQGNQAPREAVLVSMTSTPPGRRSIFLISLGKSDRVHRDFWGAVEAQPDMDAAASGTCRSDPRRAGADSHHCQCGA